MHLPLLTLLHEIEVPYGVTNCKLCMWLSMVFYGSLLRAENFRTYIIHLSLTRCASNGEMRITLARLAASTAKMTNLKINSQYNLLSGYEIPALGYGV